VRLAGAIAPAGILILAALAGAPASQAAGTPALPEDFSAADQYVESVPTSSGPRSAKQEKRKAVGGGNALLPPAASRLDEPLREVATSPRLGAPQRKLPHLHAPAKGPSVPSAAVSAVAGGDGGRLIWLLLALAFVTGAVVATASHRHLQRRRTVGNS
jgi:hypothetical protein